MYFFNFQFLLKYIILQILFKLDLYGSCLLVDTSTLHLSMNCHINKFTFDKFLYMCILSGCDYLDSLPGIGLAKACKFVLKTEDDDIRRALGKIPAYLNMRHLTVSDEYKDEFLKAVATFRYMFVYDPINRQMKRLNDLADDSADVEWCGNAGTLMDDRTAFQLALGNIDPFSMKQLDTWNPDKDIKVSKMLNILLIVPRASKNSFYWVCSFSLAAITLLVKTLATSTSTDASSTLRIPFNRLLGNIFISLCMSHPSRFFVKFLLHLFRLIFYDS